MLTGVAHAAQPEQQRYPTAQDTPAQAEDVATQPRFIARKEPVEQLFKALGSEMHKTFRVSLKARSYRVSGEFDLGQPFEVLERVTASLGLTWYYDGQVVYVYDGSESTSVMLQIPSGSANELITFLKDASLYDHRFPLKHSSQHTGLIYLSAPPKYVEIVQSAASLMQAQASVQPESGRIIEVIKLRHAFVSNRSVTRRDSTEIVPGLAQVLSEVMGRGVIVDVAGFNAAGRPALPNDVAGGRPELPSEMAKSNPQAAAASNEGELPALQSAQAFAKLFDPPASELPAPVRRTGWSAPMRIVAYATTNSLLLEGSAEQIAMARRVIAQLDQPKEQVELSLWVIDVQKQQADEIGAQWAAGGKLGSVEVGFNASVLGQGATLSRSDTMKFIASVTALAKLSKARIVSRPILLAQDNSAAVFDNSKSFYVRIEGERIASLQKVTYGTMINVLPHVVDSRGRIEMELSVEDGYSAAASPDLRLDLPIVSTTSISTMARVQHQQSLLIGGYTLNERTEGTSKIPLLGDIPYLGRLFTFRNSSDVQSVRLFLIQPRLLAEDGDFDSRSIDTPPKIDDAVDALRAQFGRSRGG